MSLRGGRAYTMSRKCVATARAKHLCTEELGLHAIVETHRIERLSPPALRQWLAALIPGPRLHLTRLSGLVALDAQPIKAEAQGAAPPTHSCSPSAESERI